MTAALIAVPFLLLAVLWWAVRHDGEARKFRSRSRRRVVGGGR